MPRLLPGLAALALAAMPAAAQLMTPPLAAQPSQPRWMPNGGAPCPCPPVGPGGVPALPNPQDPGAAANPNAGLPGQNDPIANAFAQGTEGGGAAATSFNDSFNGDFCGTFITRRIPTPPTVGPNGQIQTSRVVVTASTNRYNGQLISDNDGPRPVDRAYFGYNYYNGIATSVRQGLSRTDMYRETMGFEKTLFDGNASIGFRLPFVQLNGPAGIETANVGDLGVIGKYAFYNDRRTGDVLTAGLMLSLPTGNGNRVLGDGSFITKSVLFQPFLGGVKVCERGYAQGLTGVVVPTDPRDPVLFENSVGVGYFLYQNAFDRFVNAVVPSFEVHVRTPLNGRDPTQPIFFQDQVNITTGVHFRTTYATVSPAICIPLLNLQAYNAEFSLAVNVRY